MTIVVDTNVLVYSTFQDTEFHKESVELIQNRDIIIPQIVVFEYVKVLSDLTNDTDFIRIKVIELENFKILHESLDVIQRGLQMLKDDNSSLKNINDYIILSLTLSLNADLATYDKKLKKIAEKRNVKVIP